MDDTLTAEDLKMHIFALETVLVAMLLRDPHCADTLAVAQQLMGKNRSLDTRARRGLNAFIGHLEIAREMQREAG